jgi:hypothetical protein
MAEVALTSIRYGPEGEYDAQGNYKEKKPTQVINPGEKVTGLSKEQMDELRANGAVGDESLLVTSAQSTAAVLQSEETEHLAEADLAAAGLHTVNVPPPDPASEDEVAKAHALRTDQVARAAGEEPTTESPSNEEDQPKAAKSTTKK